MITCLVDELNVVLHRLTEEQLRQKLELLRERDPRRAEDLANVPNVPMYQVGEEEFIR